MPDEQKPKIKVWIKDGGKEFSNQVLEAVMSLKRRVQEKLPNCECVGNMTTFDGEADIIITVNYDHKSGRITYTRLFDPSVNLEDMAFGQITAFANLRRMVTGP